MLNNKCAAADFGNSRVKILAGGKHEAFHYGDTDAIVKFIAFAGVRILGYSTVNPVESDQILGKLYNEVVNVITPQTLIAAQNRIDFSDISGMGTDRAFGLIAASTISDGDLATVDCGTAVTVNISSKGKAVGGAIFCGFYTQHRAMRKFTAGVRNVKPQFEYDFPGNNTINAVNSGIILSIAGGVRLMIEKAEKEKGFSFKKIIFTGGYSGEIAEQTGFSDHLVVVDDNLVLEGIRISLDDYLTAQAGQLPLKSTN